MYTAQWLSGDKLHVDLCALQDVVPGGQLEQLVDGVRQLHLRLHSAGGRRLDGARCGQPRDFLGRWSQILPEQSMAFPYIGLIYVT